MTQHSSIKEIHDFKYYTGAEPRIKAHFRSGHRPTEFGNKVWATSLVLIDYLKTHPSEFRSQRVLEIGCGWGLIGVFLAKTYSCAVTCSDLDESVLPVVQLHADLNEVPVKVEKASFNDLDTEFLKDFDIIIGAEVCYSDEVAQDIVQLIERAFKAGVKKVLIADPGRPDFIDCYESCQTQYKTDLTLLPGTVNGKTTQLLSIQPQGSSHAKS